MNLKRYECFLAVAEELHFGRAAVRLHMSQPPLSQQIRALEQELGVKLFERTSKAVNLTPSGEAFLPEARNVLESARRAEETARGAQRGESGRFDVGFVNPAMDGPLAGALRALRLDRPRLELSLQEMSSPAQLAELRAGKLHIGFVRHGWLDFSGLDSALVFRENYVLALPGGHPLADYRRVPLELLNDAPLIMYPRSVQPRLYDAMLAALHTAGVSPRIVQEAMTKPTTLSLVAAGVGVALVPETSMVWRRRGVCFRKLDGGLPSVELAAVWRKRPHPAALPLVELVRNEAQAAGTGQRS